MKKYQIFLSENFQFLEVKFSIYLNRRVFVMGYLFFTYRHIYHLLTRIKRCRVGCRSSYYHSFYICCISSTCYFLCSYLSRSEKVRLDYPGHSISYQIARVISGYSDQPAHTHTKQNLYRPSEENLTVWLAIECNDWSACANAQTDPSHCLADMLSCRNAVALR